MTAIMPMEVGDLTGFVARLFDYPELLLMGHNQVAEDRNLGLGWLYYALGRLIHPRRAVVIGSYRGFVPLLVGRALHDNREAGEVTFIDPSMVDDFWKDPATVAAHFRELGAPNVRHFCMKTEEFVETEDYRRLGPIGLLFVDGHHSFARAEFDYRAFERLLEPRGMALFHDSLVVRRSTFYGEENAYVTSVRDYMDTLKQDRSLQVFDLPFGSGLTLVRKLDPNGVEPLILGRQAPPK